MGASQAPIIRSRDIAMNTAISMAASSMLEGMRSTPSRWRSIPAAGSSQASPGPSIRGTSSGLPGDRRRREAPGSPSCRARPPRPSAVAVLAVPPFWLATAIVLHVIFLPPICGAAASREARRFRNRNRERGLVALRPSADRPRVRVSPSGTVVPMRNTRLESAGTGLEFPVFLPFRKPIPLRVTE